jgi:hypothetical protein
MRILKSKKGIALLAVVAVAAISAVGAYAYFTSTGTGSGSATVGTSTAWQVTTDAATGGPLTPGGASTTYEAVAYRVKNNSTGHQNLANVNVKVANADGTAWTAVAGCSASDFQLSIDGGSTWGAAGASVNDTALAGNLAPSGVTSDGTITIRMIDSGSNQDGCKNATVPLYLYAS